MHSKSKYLETASSLFQNKSEFELKIYIYHTVIKFFMQSTKSVYCAYFCIILECNLYTKFMSTLIMQLEILIQLLI